MKIISLNTKKIYDIQLSKSGENQMPCPDCSGDRKKPRAKPFSFNAQNKVGYCQHCLAKFVEYSSMFQKKEYDKPVWKNKTELSDNAVKWFEKRGISQETVKKMKIYSDTEYMPQIEKETGVICFPYFLDETLVNIKYRDNKKNFKLSKNAELIFYNINSIKGNNYVVITEGEIDCLSYLQSGINSCISVPNGASGTNLEYIDNYVDMFENLEAIYISTDSDLKGFELRNELVRRFGHEKCKVIELDDCKDANEFIIKYGCHELKEKFETAKDFPVAGIISVDDNYDECYNLFVNGMQKGKSVGLEDLDSLVTWELGRVVAVTGIPGHGKSEFVDYIVVLLNLIHKWKAGYFSPENYPFKYHFSKLSSKLIGKSFDAKYMSNIEFEMSLKYITDNFFFVYPEDDMTFENILSKAVYLVKKHGIRQFVFDPYNKIEHLRNKGETETDYISRFLDRVCVFAKKYQVLVWIVAHPRKMEKNKDELAFKVPTLYDINGSANFYNKVDYGLTVYRDYTNKNIQIHIQKVKFKHLGDGGMVKLKYNYINGRFECNYVGDDSFDNKPYIGGEMTYIDDRSIDPERRVNLEPNLNFYEVDNKEPF